MLINKIHRREFDNLFEEKTLKFKIKSKARIGKVEEMIDMMKRKNTDLADELKREVYRSEEDTIRKLIKIEESIKPMMTKHSVYDHVKEEANKVLLECTQKFETHVSKVETDIGIVYNNIRTMELINDKRDK